MAAILAPIMAAVATMSAASTQAEADKFIATTAANASITQTKIQADVTRALSKNQRELSEQNLAVTQQLAREQEQNRKERVNLQLAAIQQERVAQKRERDEIRQIEQQRVDRQIAFAKEQSDENLRLAKLAINTQLVAQGLATGNSVAGTRGRLTVGAAGTVGTGGVGSQIGGLTARAVAGGENGENGQSNSLSRGLSGLISGLVGNGKNAGTNAKGNLNGKAGNGLVPRANASRALLASVSNPKVGLSAKARGASNTSKLTVRPTNTRRGFGSSSSGFALGANARMNSLLNERMREVQRAIMSTRENRNRIPSAGKGVSDLSSVIRNVRQGGNISREAESFSNYFETESKAKAKAQALKNAKKQEELAGAYNAPTTGRALVGPKRGNIRSHSLGF